MANVEFLVVGCMVQNWLYVFGNSRSHFQGLCDLFYGIAAGNNKKIGRGLTSIMTIIAANGKHGLEIAKGFGGLLAAAGLAGR